MAMSDAELRADVRKMERQRIWIVALGLLAVIVLGAAILRLPVQGWIAILIVVSVSLGTAGRSYRSMGRRRAELLQYLGGEGNHQVDPDRAGIG